MRLAGLVATMVLGGCMSTQASYAKPAMLASPSAQSARIIQNAIASLTHGQKIKLADNVFGDKSTIIVERARQNDDRGNPLDGRDNNAPADTFTLLKTADGCVLRHDQTGKQMVLSHLKCKPV